MKHFKTEKGTELPIMEIKGKPYLQVAHRLVWFNEKYPTWSIETELKAYEKYTDARAVIRDDTGRVRATGHKRETSAGFPDHYEKSETGAIGRALAFIGIGTQFVGELEEGARLADAPTQPAKKYFENIAERALAKKDLQTVKTIEGPMPPDIPFEQWDKELGEVLQNAGPGSYTVPFGKYKGQKIEDISPIILKKDVEYWRSKEAQGERLGFGAKEFVQNAEAFLNLQ